MSEQPVYLIPHAWDAIARPPAPGGNYPTADLRDEEAEIETLLDEARGYDEDERRAEEEAEEAREGAIEAREQARVLIEERVRPNDGDAADRLLKKISLG